MKSFGVQPIFRQLGKFSCFRRTCGLSDWFRVHVFHLTINQFRMKDAYLGLDRLDSLRTPDRPGPAMHNEWPSPLFPPCRRERPTRTTSEVLPSGPPTARPCLRAGLMTIGWWMVRSIIITPIWPACCSKRAPRRRRRRCRRLPPKPRRLRRRLLRRSRSLRRRLLHLSRSLRRPLRRSRRFHLHAGRTSRSGSRQQHSRRSRGVSRPRRQCIQRVLWWRPGASAGVSNMIRSCFRGIRMTENM